MKNILLIIFSIILNLYLYSERLTANKYSEAMPDSSSFLVGKTIPTQPDLFQKTQYQWNALPPVDFSTLSPDSIKDWLMDRPAGQGTEYDINYYIGHFHQLANAVVTTGPNQGFIDISVWRNAADNEPYNARIMENITTLAWFYTREENWNPYYAHPDLRNILEAALTFWVNMQSDDGRFSEYREGGWNLAATAFATKFMGKTLEMLVDGPEIDPLIHEQVKQANRKALMVVFTSELLYSHGMRFSNQFGNAFTGALAHLDMNPDDHELREAFEACLETSQYDFQSQAGFYSENYGPDWSYAFGTHHSNILMAWHYARHSETLAEHYKNEHERFINWLSYNAVMQPGDEFFMLHRSVETRQSRAILTRLETPLSEVVPMARAFNTTQEEVVERLPEIRQRVASGWGNIPALQIGNFSGYSAYSLLHRDHYRWNPTEAQRQEAVESLPYLASENFIHQRTDNLTDFETTFIRKPTYYAAFSSGEQQTEQQRFGLGLLWNPVAGTVFQSQSRSETAAWGTIMHQRTTLPWEAFPMEAEYTVDGVAVDPVAGNKDLGNGILEITYSLGSTGPFAGIGEKKLIFHEDVITVNVSHTGSFTEVLPLVTDGNSDVFIDHENGVIQIFTNEVPQKEKLRIELANPQDIESIYKVSGSNLGSGMSVRPVHIKTTENLSYTITLNPQEPITTDVTGDIAPEIPAIIRITGSYPNPVTQGKAAYIAFELHSGSDVHLELFSIMGKRIMAKNYGYHAAGRHKLMFSSSDLAPGNYLVRLEASGQVQSIPITLLSMD